MKAINTGSFKRSAKRLSFFAACLIAVCFFSACVKYVPGPKGDQGEPGKKGNMVLSSTNTYVVLPSAWLASGRGWETQLVVPEITSAAITSGEIKVYVLVSGAWWALPYSTGSLFTQYTAEQGLLKLSYLKVHGGTPLPSATSYRVVVFAKAG